MGCISQSQTHYSEVALHTVRCITQNALHTVRCVTYRMHCVQ